MNTHSCNTKSHHCTIGPCFVDLAINILVFPVQRVERSRESTSTYHSWHLVLLIINHTCECQYWGCLCNYLLWLTHFLFRPFLWTWSFYTEKFLPEAVCRELGSLTIRVLVRIPEWFHKLVHSHTWSLCFVNYVRIADFPITLWGVGALYIIYMYQDDNFNISMLIVVFFVIV